MANSGQFTSKTASARLGYGVGDLEFLTSKQSHVNAYFRGLEYGSDKMVGRTIYGVFGLGSRYAHAGGPFYARAGEFGGGKGKMQFFPLGYAAAQISNRGNSPTRRMLNHLRSEARQGTKGKGKNRQSGGISSRSLEVTIEHPIVAQNAYQQAFEQFKPGERERAAVEQVLGNLGFHSEGRGGVINNQKFTRFADLRTQRRAPVTAAQIRTRFGTITGGATSGYTGSLANIDKRFQADLIRINAQLAEALAQDVARIQKDEFKRPGTSTGQLVNATLDPRNRFPR